MLDASSAAPKRAADISTPANTCCSSERSAPVRAEKNERQVLRVPHKANRLRHCRLGFFKEEDVHLTVAELFGLCDGRRHDGLRVAARLELLLDRQRHRLRRHGRESGELEGDGAEVDVVDLRDVVQRGETSLCPCTNHMQRT